MPCIKLKHIKQERISNYKIIYNTLNDFENKLIKYIESQPSFLDSPFEYSLIKFIDLIK